MISGKITNPNTNRSFQSSGAKFYPQSTPVGHLYILFLISGPYQRSAGHRGLSLIWTFWLFRKPLYAFKTGAFQKIRVNWVKASIKSRFQSIEKGWSNIWTLWCYWSLIRWKRVFFTILVEPLCHWKNWRMELLLFKNFEWSITENADEIRSRMFGWCGGR